jgi:hypothetical protein
VRQRGLGNSAGTQSSIHATIISVFSKSFLVLTLDWVPACDPYGIVACRDAGITRLCLRAVQNCEATKKELMFPCLVRRNDNPMRSYKTPFLILAALFGLWLLIAPWTTLRYRLTFEVETPEGLKTGSGVNMAGYSAEPAMFGANPFHWGVWKGEAIPVDLGNRGTFYALLIGRDEITGAPDAGRNQAEMVGRTLVPEAWTGNQSGGTVGKLYFASGKADVPASLIPFLVRFRDEKDPKTVEAVDRSNLAASFGPGVALKRVWIEAVSGGVFPFNMMGITGTPVTTGIEKRLGWLGEFPEPNLDPGGPAVGGPIATAPLNRLLTHGNFRRRN